MPALSRFASDLEGPLRVEPASRGHPRPRRTCFSKLCPRSAEPKTAESYADIHDRAFAPGFDRTPSSQNVRTRRQPGRSGQSTMRRSTYRLPDNLDLTSGPASHKVMRSTPIWKTSSPRLERSRCGPVQWKAAPMAGRTRKPAPTLRCSRVIEHRTHHRQHRAQPVHVAEA